MPAHDVAHDTLIQFRAGQTLAPELTARADRTGETGPKPGSRAKQDVERYYALTATLRDGPMSETLRKFNDWERERIREVLTGKSQEDLAPGRLAAGIEDAAARSAARRPRPEKPLSRNVVPVGPIIQSASKRLEAKVRELDTVTLCVLVDSLGMRP